VLVTDPHELKGALVQMNKLARNTLALGTATMIVTAGISFAANGADATKSYSTGRFLTGSIGGTNLDTIAQLRGVAAANPGNAGANKNPLDLTVLSSIPVNVPGGLNLDVAKLLSPSKGSAGTVSQYASAESTSKAIGASGLVNDSGAVLTTGGGVPADAKISLKNGPLAGINDNLASVDLGLGAVSSNTTVDNGNPSRKYQIAGLNLQLGVPLVADLVDDLSNAVDPLTKVSDITLSPAQLCAVSSTALTVSSSALLAQLGTLGVPALVLEGVDAILNPVLGTKITEVNLCDPSNPLAALLTNDVIGSLIEVQITGIDQVTTGIDDFSDGGVSVNLSTGKITLDLGQILKAANVDLNNLPPNTDIVSFITSDLISGKITDVLNSAIDKIVAKISAVNVKVSVAGTALPLQLTDLTGPVAQPLNDALKSVTDAVKQVGTPLDAALADLAPNLRQLVQLIGNNQSSSKTPTLSTGTVNAGSTKAGGISTAAVGDYYRTSALRIRAINGSLLDLDIAASEAATLAADRPADQQGAGPGSDRDDDSNGPSTDRDSDSVADGAQADNGDDSDTVADSDAQADADVTTTLPSTGAPNLLPFWLLGIALLLFGGAVLLNEKRRLNQI
jgi:hypothetical protein